MTSTPPSRPAVTLVPVGAAVLEALVLAATAGADADEVTPPLGAEPGSGWSAGRVAWLRSFHVERRPGLDGPLGEATWAVLADQHVVGSVRLARAVPAGVLTTGAWLTLDVRGAGVGRAAMTAVLGRAAAWGAGAVVAETTPGNLRAQAVLRRLGFTLSAGDEQVVHAHLDLVA